MGAFEDNFGKIGSRIFKEELLPFTGATRKELLRGPAFGVDTAVIDLGNGQAMAVSSDPLSLIPAMGMEASAWLSVHLLVNDMVTTGHSPQFAQFVLNLPPTLSQADFAEYWQHLHRLCQQMDIAISGGHTGQIEGQNSTIAGGGTMFLTAPRDTILTSDKARPGDLIVVTKEAALSSTAILALCFPETVSQALGAVVQKKLAANFRQLSVRNEALLAAQILSPIEELTAMHDVTEGGILGAIGEMAQASRCGFKVENDLIPISEEVQALCRLFDIDPRLSIGAGSMIMAVNQGSEEKLLAALREENIPATVVGRFTPATAGLTLVENDKEKEFDFSGEDPYWQAFFKALKNGWQ